ncbi:hypothetical protein [Prevotella sp. 10(H)]|uniref:hypothetical protein n=1 Tax=Prevotella sp. 10(H) TaxID=1158294 RepID=UPI0004A6CA84|nr:hypothetical protein [Prevotella sp. 10(H)]
MKNRLIILLFSLIPILPLVSQNNKDILKYLDDGGIATSRYIGKINLTSIYEGEIGISLERLISDNFAIETGVGLLLPNYKDPLFYDLLSDTHSEDFTFNDPKTGYSIMINPKYYLKELSEGFYWALPLRYRIYPGQIHLFDFSMNAGIQWVWDSGIVLDFSAGIGATMQNSRDKKSYIFDAGNKVDINWESNNIVPGNGIENSEPSKIRFQIPVSVKIGYRFKSK